MTDFRDQPASNGIGPLARYHRALPGLAVLLRGADLPVGPDRWQNVYDLLLALDARGRLPQGIADLEPLIAPLLCRSAREQERFGELFARWLADLEPDLRGSGEETDAPPKLPRLRGWLSGLVLLFVVLVGASYWSHIQPPPSPDRPVPSSPSRNGQTVPLPKETAGLKLRPIPPRTPLEGPTLYPVHRARLETLGDLLLILPGLLALVWLLVRWLTWRVVLARRRGDPDDPLTTVGLDARADDLLAAPDLRQTLICRGPVRPALATARFRPAQGAVAPLSGGGPSAGP